MWFKRIFLFLVVNMLVMVTVSVTLSLLGVNRYLYSSYGIDYQSLAIFCLVWGMAGSFISLGLSRIMAKMMMGVQIIDPNTRDPEHQNLVQMIYHLARAANLPKMPEVGIYDSPDLNAFATGPSKARSLVAVSSGLLSNMNSQELEGVLAHEISHVANGDMVTLTLIQGIINAFVMFLARILAYALTQIMRGDNEREEHGPSWAQFIMVPIFEIFLSILGSIVVAWFSRFREFRADAGSARLAGREKMIAALHALKRFHERAEVETQAPPAFQAMQISSRKEGFLSFFASHPPLEVRIERLEMMRT